VHSSDDGGRLPNLIIVGVSRGGTTSLFNYLVQHPDVCGSDVKELRYFAPLRHGGDLAPIQEYARHFRQCTGARYALEATPGYFYGGRRLAQGLRATLPGVSALVSLRDPVERCWSWFRFGKSRLRLPEDMSFDTYLDRCEDLHRAGVDGELEHQPFWGMGGGCYATWFDEWVEEFGNRFRVLFFEDLARDPVAEMRAICRWLDLDERVVDEFTLDAENRTAHYRTAGLHRIAVAVNRRNERFFRRYPGLKRAVRSAYQAVNRRPSGDEMSPTARRRLVEFYRPHNAELGQALARLGLHPPRWVTEPE
jgi:hypothetical protein